jgi:hypothetical protein
MKVGQQYYDKSFGYGIVSEITTAGFTVKFYARTVFYPHLRNEKMLAVLVWFCIIAVSVLGIGYFVL